MRRSVLTRPLDSLSIRGQTCNSDVHASTASGSPGLDAHGAMPAPERSARCGTVARSSIASAGCAAPGVGPSGYAVRSTPRGVLPVWAAAHGIRPPPSESTTSSPWPTGEPTSTTMSNPSAWGAIGSRHAPSSPGAPRGSPDDRSTPPGHLAARGPPRPSQAIRGGPVESSRKAASTGRAAEREKLAPSRSRFFPVPNPPVPNPRTQARPPVPGPTLMT